VHTDRADVDPAWLAAWLQDKERVLSRFETASELSRLNAGDGGWVEVSPLLFDLLEVAVLLARQTGGLVTPTVLRALCHAGYDRSFALGLDGRGADDSAAPDVPSVDGVELDPRRRAVRLPRGVGLDLGGFAKGYLAEALARELGAPTLVDLGGDIALRGPQRDGTAWVIETEPDAEGATRCLLLERGGIATSGTDRRRWGGSGRSCHHLIDPRTGRASATDLVRATVIAPDALVAETVAKLALLLGRRAAMDYVDARPELAALFLTEEGREWPSARFADYVWSEA
jgi:thiamine biosynthesis lipoprotein